MANGKVSTQAVNSAQGKQSKLTGPGQPGFSPSGTTQTKGATQDLTQFGRDPATIKAQQEALQKQIQQLSQQGGNPFQATSPQTQEQIQQLQQESIKLSGEAGAAGGDEQERARRFEQLRQFREKDLAAGRERAEELFGEGSFGRLEGMDEGQTQALRETRLRNLNRLQQQQQRQLGGVQAQAGIQGGLAGQQLQGLQGQQQQEQQAAEQELLLGTASQQREVDKFNVEQGRREILARSVRELGEAGLGISERGAILSQLASEAGADATREAGGGGGSFCFITTAVCEKLGLPDDNPILNKFRKFRDEHMGGKPGVGTYYDIAPKIVEAIKERGEEDVYYMILSGYLIPSLHAIDKGDVKVAEEIYTEMVQKLSEAYLPKIEVN
jgi:hypothetical protein